MKRNPENESEQLPSSVDIETEAEADATPINAEENPCETNDEALSEPSVVEDEADFVLPAAKKDPLSLTRIVFEYLELFVASLCIVFLVFMFGVRLCNVRGESMEKTLYEKERLLISNLFYEPEREDIIVFHQTGDYLNEPVVKRVIATGGETVVLEYRSAPQTIVVTVYSDETMKTVLDESAYAYYDGTPKMEYTQQEKLVYHVPEGYLFVLGDNRNHSADSRSPAVGLVDERRVLGKVIGRISPLSRFGAVG